MSSNEHSEIYLIIRKHTYSDEDPEGLIEEFHVNKEKFADWIWPELERLQLQAGLNVKQYVVKDG
jgi:hypothetical protein